MARIGFLACETTLPGSGQRRNDAYEHDLMVGALAPALTARGAALHVVDWEAAHETFAGLDLVLLGTAWNYQDKPAAFLQRIEELEAAGIIVCNPGEVVRWNMRKTYLRALEAAGARTIPTIWTDAPSRDDVAIALDAFAADRLVVKRQVGAGALGQEIWSHDNLPPAGWRFAHRAMLQPFLPAIKQEGEYSFVFIDGAFSHALRKRAADGDYRIQSMYGGYESDHAPAPQDIAAAEAILALLPFSAPLYARIDMVRGEDGGLLLMEAELIEPYLYPEQGRGLAERLAAAIERRLA